MFTSEQLGKNNPESEVGLLCGDFFFQLFESMYLLNMYLLNRKQKKSFF